MTSLYARLTELQEKAVRGPLYVVSSVENIPESTTAFLRRRTVHNVFRKEGKYGHVAECAYIADADVIAELHNLLPDIIAALAPVPAQPAPDDHKAVVEFFTLNPSAAMLAWKLYMNPAPVAQPAQGGEAVAYRVRLTGSKHWALMYEPPPQTMIDSRQVAEVQALFPVPQPAVLAQDPVAEVLWYDPQLEIMPRRDGHKIIDASMAWMDHAPIGTKLYASPLPAASVPAWMPLTPELLKQIARDDDPQHYWLFNGHNVSLGYYEWREGWNPDWFISEGESWRAKNITHVMTASIPAPPLDPATPQEQR